MNLNSLLLYILVLFYASFSSTLESVALEQYERN